MCGIISFLTGIILLQIVTKRSRLESSYGTVFLILRERRGVRV